MKILLDTNIIIHREANRVTNDDIGSLFNWLDRLKYTKCIHPISVVEINKNPNKETVRMMQIKMTSYYQLKTSPPLHPSILDVSNRLDVPGNENDKNDNILINEVYSKRVNILITEDKKIHRKAAFLGINEQVFNIEDFIGKCIKENPEQIDYKVLSVKRELFGDIDVSESFFDSFRRDYDGFDKWFNDKSENTAYVFRDGQVLGAFLYIKLETGEENYWDIIPQFSRKKRLKIGTFKVVANGLKLGERFLKIVFDNARQYKVDDIYVTVFEKTEEQKKLIALLEDFGFTYHGLKTSGSREEKVYVRDFSRGNANRDFPRRSFPWISTLGTAFIVPIKPEFHTSLFPDSILRTESPFDFVESEPHRNSISKVYISHSPNRNLHPGDILVFYRTGGMYKGVATTICIVETVIDNLQTFEQLEKCCDRKTVLTNEELKEYWDRPTAKKPFVVNVLYAFSFKKRLTLKQLLEHEIIPSQDWVRTINPLEWNSLTKLIKISGI